MFDISRCWGDGGCVVTCIKAAKWPTAVRVTPVQWQTQDFCEAGVKHFFKKGISCMRWGTSMQKGHLAGISMFYLPLGSPQVHRGYF